MAYSLFLFGPIVNYEVRSHIGGHSAIFERLLLKEISQHLNIVVLSECYVLIGNCVIWFFFMEPFR